MTYTYDLEDRLLTDDGPRSQVVDISGQPVADIALQLTVSGANTYTASATTNSSGIAALSYTGTNPGLSDWQLIT